MYILLLAVLGFGLWIIYLRVLRKLTVGRYNERHVLVTGCDSGFGNLLTKRLDLLGFKVFACCLSKSGVEGLKSECSVNVTAIQMDVTSDASIEGAIENVKAKIPKDKGLFHRLYYLKYYLFKFNDICLNFTCLIHPITLSPQTHKLTRYFTYGKYVLNKYSNQLHFMFLALEMTFKAPTTT